MTRDEERAQQRAAAVDRTRIVVDPQGRQWTVRELEGPSYDRRTTARSLVFVCDDAMRRVRNYPADWFDWSNDALYGLSFGR